MKHPRGLAAGVMAAALCLAGCDVSGTIDFAPDSVTYDLTIDSTDTGFCQGSTHVTQSTLPDGRTRCRLAMTEPYQPDNWDSVYLLGASAVGDQRVAILLQRSYFSETPDPLTTVDLTITVPGPVLLSPPGSQAGSNTVRLTDPEVLKSEGLLVVGARHPGPPPWVLTVVGAAGVLLAGIGAGWWLRGRGRPAPPPGPVFDEAEPTAPGDDEAAPAASAPIETYREPEDPAVWARED